MSRRNLLVGAYVLLSGITAAWAAEVPVVVEAGETAGGSTRAVSSMEEIWVVQGAATPGQQVSLSVSAAESTPAKQPVTFTGEVRSRSRFDHASVRMSVTDAQGAVVTQGDLVMQILEGENSFGFEWNASALPEGLYHAAFDIKYTEEDAPAIFGITLKKVSSTQLTADLASLTGRLATLRKQVDAASSPGRLPYLHMRLGIADMFAGLAGKDAEHGAWRPMDSKLAYLQRTCQTVDAGLAFSSVTPELAVEVVPADLSGLQLRDGAVFSGERPVFLFGRVLGQPGAEAVAALRALGLNLAVVNLPPSVTLTGPSETAAFQSQFDPVFDQAAANNISVVTQLAPDDPGSWVLDACPDIVPHGFADLTHPAMREIVRRHLETVIPYLASRKMVGAISLLRDPRFRFDTEEVRQAFLERVMAQYPDRQGLNQTWHAHLANYDEITIWDDSAPEWSYQNRRAYQHDWQDFHRGLIQEYFQHEVETVHNLNPGLSLTATLPDNLFELAETRMAPEREALAQLLDISGCSVTADYDDRFYGVGYPHPSAFYTLLKSMAEDKPVFSLESRLVFNPALDPARAYAFVHTAVWEAVIDGVSAMALAADTPVFDRPETTEAYATACLDINRLASVVHAFQQAPPEVAILFSDASKVYDDGNPHLKSARYAYEGCSFSGHKTCFITEKQLMAGALDRAKVLVIPQTPAVSDAAFNVLLAYTRKGGAVARVGTPIPYDERGQSRRDVVQNTGNTVLVRGMNLPTEYLHAMDAAMVLGSLPRIPRPINASGYPLEGVKTRFVEVDGEPYLYMVNLRKTSLNCHLAGGLQTGRDLIRGRDVVFPRVLEPLDPMLIHLEKLAYHQELAASVPQVKK
jgi:hypothetical protein